LRAVTFTKERAIKELEKLRTDESSGIDAMHPKIIKELRGSMRGIEGCCERLNVVLRSLEKVCIQEIAIKVLSRLGSHCYTVSPI